MKDGPKAKTAIQEAVNSLSAGLQAFNRGGGDFYLRKLIIYADTLFSRYAPFKIGDRVKLTKSFTTESRAHGWHHCQHFLTRGAVATVHDVDVDEDGSFIVDIMFDNETWIPSFGEDKKPRPVSNKHTFRFGEDWIEKLPKKLFLLLLLSLSITSAEACNFKFICKKLTKLPEYSIVGFKLGWEDVKNGNKLFFPVYEIRGFKNGLQAWRDFGGHEDDPEYLNEKATQIMWNLMEKD